MTGLRRTRFACVSLLASGLMATATAHAHSGSAVRGDAPCAVCQVADSDVGTAPAATPLPARSATPKTLGALPPPIASRDPRTADAPRAPPSSRFDAKDPS